MLRRERVYGGRRAARLASAADCYKCHDCVTLLTVTCKKLLKGVPGRCWLLRGGALRLSPMTSPCVLPMHPGDVGDQ